MTIDDILLETEEKMLKTEEHLLSQFAGVRTGKASPGLIENIQVEAYGSLMRLRELTTINVPEPRMFMLQPFDAANVKAIEKAIQSSNLGLSPAVQGRFIRIVLPDLSTERRQEFVRICKDLAEAARVAMRTERRQANEALKKVKQGGGVSEDDIKAAEEETQKLTDQYSAKIDEHLAHKTKEILTV